VFWWELDRPLPSAPITNRRVLTPIPRAPHPFLRAVEAQSEMHPEGKERLVGAIHEPHEAIKFPKKQPEAEEEVESILQQEASRLSLEKRVREVMIGCLYGGVAEREMGSEGATISK
jgi:hypothetical protein